MGCHLRSNINKDSNGQGNSEDSVGELLYAERGHNLEERINR